MDIRPLNPLTFKKSDPKPGWIGVDLDGTLTVYRGWHGPAHIGEPVAKMVAFVRHLLKAGWEVRVVTARAGLGVGEYMAFKPVFDDWCRTHLGQYLKCTDRKDFKMFLLYDDRAVQVETNTGESYGPYKTTLHAD